MKQKLKKVTLAPRQSRHGKPLTEVYKKRSVTIVTDEKTGEMKTTSHERTMTPDEIQAKRTIMVASGPTKKKGLRNLPQEMKKNQDADNQRRKPDWWKETA